jgi:pimeloyl-ACP methyl ester carboxylesterase/predicted glycosyltransferase
MRARPPDQAGYVERDGVRVGYEVFGEGEPALLLLPCFQIVQSRVWKGQVPYLARRWRVITFDARGTGRSDNPVEADAYADDEVIADAIAVLDVCGVERAIVVGFSKGSWWGPLLAATYPERVLGLALIGASSNVEPTMPPMFERALAADGAFPSWDTDYRGFLEFFFSNVFPEAHSTKQIEDSLGWGLETNAEVLALAISARVTPEHARVVYDAVSCPVSVIQGTDDRVAAYQSGADLARELRANLVTLEGSGHNPAARDPVRVNLLLREFVELVTRPAESLRRWTRARSRPRRALFVSSPIGLGHAQRDVAIARELRMLVPDLQIDWLAQDPVTRVLEVEGETIHPASQFLANESSHIESESAEHDLHCFQAWRHLDEILVANFMVFEDVVEEEPYDLWIGDEAWELDGFLHENPELKRAPFCWLTDFVGWLPMPDGGAAESWLTADYNAEMIDHIERYPHLRDRALFVGDPDDVVPETFGPGLGSIRSWTEEHFEFPGYVTGFEPIGVAERDALRAEFGFADDEVVCIVTVGGSGVGAPLLRRVTAALPRARESIPTLRMIAVTGPRIDPGAIPSIEGLEVRPYVHGLYRYLAACDVAVVQGGLTTSMELTANRRPFLYFPLRHHFEQQFHVRHRLERHHAGRALDYATATPESIAEAIADALRTPIAYREVGNAAAGAAARIAELI